MSDSGTNFQNKAQYQTAEYQTASYSTNLSDYRLLGLIGQGQFAQVYCAVHRRTGRLVAIKQIRHSREALPKEMAILRRLDHPSVVKCHAADRELLILSYCEAGTLRSHLSTAFSPQFIPRHLPSPIAKYLIEDVLEGLDYLHQRGIIHSDLKPENILLTVPIPNRLTAKISDFGCAHTLDQPIQSTTDIGSPSYSAPERFEGHSSIASDLYSIGVILYELLVGNRPFIGTPLQLRQAHKNQSLSFPNTLSSSAQQFLSTALHKQANRRFASASEMLSALRKLETSPVQTAATSHRSVTTVDFSQRTKPVPAHGITSPVASLVALPQGCSIITANSLHILTPKKRLMSMARFRQPCWISVSPTGKWFVALPKENTEENAKENNKRHTRGMIGRLSQLSGHQWSRSITLTGRLLTTLLSNVVQIIAIDSRHFVRIRTAQDSVRTYVECFTRRGQLVGELRLNQTITQIIPTASPYQLIALSAERPASPAVVLLIDLKPFQIRTVRLPFVPQRVHALDWGYLVAGGQMTVLLDRDAQPTTLLKGLPDSRAIASLDSRQLLLANHATQPSLSVVDATTLNLGIIF